MLLMTLSTIAGIGGGGVVVPLLMTFFDFDTKEAIAISGFSILLCSVTRFAFNYRLKHPEKDSVALDYNLASVMLPTVLMGSFIGVLVNVSFPPLILQIILTIVLLFLTIQSGFKGKEIFNMETQKIKAR